MIFVTVGTHEQQFNRLIKEIDRLKENNVIKEEVFIQIGFSSYEPQNCKWSKFISYEEMNQKIKSARIVITHGGPATFIAPLQIGKIPIVVPRQEQFNEHINNHQLEFTKKIEERKKNIIPVYDIKDLENRVINYDKIINLINKKNISNNKNFLKGFEEKIEELINK